MNRLRKFLYIPQVQSSLAAAMAAMIFTGCTVLDTKPYGFAAPDAERIREGSQPLFIPHNAPSISQGYTPRSAGGSFSASSSDREEIDLDHTGIDIAAEKGTQVIAPAPGTVVRSYYEPLFGNRILIDHGRDKNGHYIRSKYCHLDSRSVKKGDKVVRGQLIGTLGNTGLLAFSPHLHFEIRVGQRQDQLTFEPVNPHLFWADGPGVITCYDNAGKWADAPFNTTYPVPCR